MARSRKPHGVLHVRIARNHASCLLRALCKFRCQLVLVRGVRGVGQKSNAGTVPPDTNRFCALDKVGLGDVKRYIPNESASDERPQEGPLLDLLAGMCVEKEMTLQEVEDLYLDWTGQTLVDAQRQLDIQLAKRCSKHRVAD